MDGPTATCWLRSRSTTDGSERDRGPADNRLVAEAISGCASHEATCDNDFTFGSISAIARHAWEWPQASQTRTSPSHELARGVLGEWRCLRTVLHHII